LTGIEIRGQKADDREEMTEDRRQMIDDGRLKAEIREQRTGDS
jgi:hypothetical protein